MNYIHGRNILLHTIIGAGIVFSLTTSSTIYCTPGKYDKPKDTTNERRNKEHLNAMETSLKEINASVEGMQNFAADQGKLSFETQVDKVFKSIKDVPYEKVSEFLGAVIKSYQYKDPKNADNENNIRMQVANGDDTPPQPVSMYDVVPKPRPVPDAHPQTTPIPIDGVNNDNIPQNTLNENMYTPTNNSNLHSSQVKARNKRSIPYDSEDDNMDSYDFNEDDIRYGNIEHAQQVYKAYADDSGNHDYAEILDTHDYAEIPDTHDYAEIPDDVRAESNDSNDEYNSHRVQLRVDDESLHRIYYGENDKYEETDVQCNSKETVDGSDELNDSNNEHNSNQDDDKKIDSDDPDSPPQDINHTPTSTINVDNHSVNNNDDTEWDDNEPKNDIIADENNQLSNTYNQNDTNSHIGKAITHGDHAIFLQLFNSANYAALHRISSRLTAYALDQMRDGQLISQKLVSSGSNISNVHHEIWMMPLIKKGEKYVDNVSKYTISTYGINVGFDSKIPHCRGNIESVLGIVFALYDSQLKGTASDSATLLNTYIISMYYSIIFNQKFFIYTLFSLGTSNAGSYHSATGVNNTTLYKPAPFSSYNVFRQSVEMHAGYNIMMYDSKLDDRQVVLLPMAGMQIDTVALHGDTKKYYSSLQQLKLSTGIKIAYHRRIKSSVSINSALYGFVNYCPWSNAIIHNDQSLISNFENGTLVAKENLATCNNKLYYRIGGEASLQYNRVMYSLRYEMNIAQDYLSHQIALKIKLKL